MREGFVWNADEMGVCRGYVGVFIDSPDTQTHDKQKNEGGPSNAVNFGDQFFSSEPGWIDQASSSSLSHSLTEYSCPTPQSQARPFKNRHLNRLKPTQIRFAHL